MKRRLRAPSLFSLTMHHISPAQDTTHLTWEAVHGEMHNHGLHLSNPHEHTGTTQPCAEKQHEEHSWEKPESCAPEHLYI